MKVYWKAPQQVLCFEAEHEGELDVLCDLAGKAHARVLAAGKVEVTQVREIEPVGQRTDVPGLVLSSSAAAGGDRQVWGFEWSPRAA